MTGVEPTPIAVISGRSEFNENSALHMRCVSSGQRTVMDSDEAETVIGPARTAETSAGTVAATLITGIKKIGDRIRLGSGTTSYLRLGGPTRSLCREMTSAAALSIGHSERRSCYCF